MKQLTFFLDFLSPYAYVAFHRLPKTLASVSTPCRVQYRPVLFSALLKSQNDGQLGPGEILGKREWLLRQTQWMAEQDGLPMSMPAVHPFNPLPLLRLATAATDPMLCGPVESTDEENRRRRAISDIFDFVWNNKGRDPRDAILFADLQGHVRPALLPDSEKVKNALRQATEHAIESGVFGVPSITVNDSGQGNDIVSGEAPKMFWGVDGLPMLRDYLVQGYEQRVACERLPTLLSDVD
eukprot:INCI4184.4.p1 GENE.INCI4184.4~~INCI4184.4.p1  ORF type:complete len:239 (+),score=36.45 INCI4184.4:363-1079(+)